MNVRHADTYYARTAAGAPERPSLTWDADCDVCVVGGGLAGLTTALELQRGGRSVVLLEARRIAWGASGRNGGLVSAGYALGLRDIVRRVGPDRARALYDLSMDGAAYVRRTIDELGITGAEPTPGVLRVIRTRDEAALRARRDMMAERFGRALEYWPRDVLREQLLTDRYFAGLYDPDGFHIHPLNYALGLADELERLGGRIYEDSAVTGMERHGDGERLRTGGGRVMAGDVVLCCGGYTGRLERRLAAAILPIATYVILSEPLGDRLKDAVRTRAAVFDERLASDYSRVVEGDRLLWGGRITSRTGAPRDLAGRLKRDLLAVYPQLGPGPDDLVVDAAWSGLMGYAAHRMPQIGRLRPGVWYGTAFGGHGLNTTAVAGRLVAAAILEGDDRHRLFEPFGLTWTGGPFGPPAVQLTYWRYQLTDWWCERRARRG